MRKVLASVIVILLSLQVVAAAHYIVGVVNDARDGTSANGKTVRMRNYFTADEINSTIGPTGPSGQDNIYMFDCEMLGTACGIGDILTLEVLNDSDNYLGIEPVNVTVTGAGFDMVENMTVNSPPNSTNEYPLENGNVSSVVDFNCSAEDLDSNLYSVSLYLNYSGWHLNETRMISGGNNSTIFSKSLPEGVYEYSCSVEDERGVKSFNDENTTFNVDLTKPVISDVSYNESYVCGTSSQVRVNCTATDSFTGIYRVLIGDGQTNYSASLLSGDTYYADILVDELGNTTFECYAEDFAGNVEMGSGENLPALSNDPEFFISSILLSNLNPAENVFVTVNATVENLGCGDGLGVQVGLFDDDPDSSGTSIENKTESFLGLTTKNISLTWTSEIGITNLFVKVDSNNSFVEINESDNKVNESVFVRGWQEFYGNVSLDKLIGSRTNNMSYWTGKHDIEGNIFIVDKESDVDWSNLQAMGRNSVGGVSSNDFSEIDTILGMSSLNDSVSEVFSGAVGRSYDVHGNIINNVPSINSTPGSVFQTGILWDMGDDTNGEFDSGEKEDIVFVSEVNMTTQGAYGVYDYELKVPAKLREFDNTDTEEIYFYYDLD